MPESPLPPIRHNTYRHVELRYKIIIPDGPAPNGLPKETLENWPPFRDWFGKLTSSLKRNSRTLLGITVLSHFFFGKTKLGFVKLQAAISDMDYESVVFLRGPSVAMLRMLMPDDVREGDTTTEDDERRVVLAVQARIPAGDLDFVDLPASIVDDNNSFVGAAVTEIMQELELELTPDHLTCLNNLVHDLVVGGSRASGGEMLQHVLYPSVDGCDETMQIFMHERRLARDQLDGWDGKLTGVRKEGEKIKLRLVKMKDLWIEGARDAKCLVALAFWEKLKKEGKLPRPFI